MSVGWRDPAGRSAAAVASAIADRLGVALPSPAPWSCTWLDSVDRRLAARGEALAVEAEGRSRAACLWVDGAPGPFGRPPVPADLRWPSSLPGRLGARVAKRLGPRCLLPVVSVKGKAWTVSVTDARDKTVVRVRVADLAARRDDARAPLGVWVEVVPVRGYASAEAKAAKALAKVGLAPEGGTLLALALGALGGDRLPPSAEVPMQGDEPAERVVLRLCGALLACQRAQEAGVIADLDPEFLHDLRVAVRRQRSVVQQMRAVLPERAAAKLADDLRWVGQITGPLRDAHVHRESLPAYRSQLDASVRDALDPLDALLDQRIADAHTALVRELTGRRYARVCRDLQRFVDRTPRASPDAPTIGWLARVRVAKLHRRVLRDGRAITPESPAEALHDLRKTCKKLRYVLELFGPVFPAEAIAPAVRAMKELQSLLGTFNDLEVQADALTALGEELVAAGVGEAHTLMALGALAEEQRTRQAEVRAHFAEVFAAFDRTKTERRFAALTEAA